MNVLIVSQFVYAFFISPTLVSLRIMLALKALTPTGLPNKIVRKARDRVDGKI